MKSEDLMIGDWVSYNRTYQRVEEVNGIDNRVYLTEDEDVDCPDIYPIPITSEILEKNGFELSPDCGYEYIYEDEDRTIICCPRGTACINSACGYISVYAGCLSVEDMPIDFVHELQHALKLCEIKIEIEL